MIKQLQFIRLKSMSCATAWLVVTVKFFMACSCSANDFPISVHKVDDGTVHKSAVENPQIWFCIKNFGGLYLGIFTSAYANLAGVNIWEVKWRHIGDFINVLTGSENITMTSSTDRRLKVDIGPYNAVVSWHLGLATVVFHWNFRIVFIALHNVPHRHQL